MKGKEVLEVIATIKPIEEFVALIESYWDNYHQQSYICMMLYTLIEKAKYNMEVDIWNSKDEVENLAVLVLCDIEWQEMRKRGLIKYMVDTYSGEGDEQNH